MAAFSRKSLKSNPFMSAVRRHPFAFFGLPFLSLVVFSSYALETFTQTRYNHNDYKVQAVSQEEALRMDKNRKRVDIREEYYVRVGGTALTAADEQPGVAGRAGLCAPGGGDSIQLGSTPRAEEEEEHL